MDEMENVFGKKNDKLVYGKYRAIVKNIEDPEKLGRIQLNCPEIYGEDLSPWAWPCLPYAGISNVGIFFLPELNSGVWLEFEQGHITNPIWSGCWYTKFKGENELPQESQDNYGTHKIIRTKSGHSIEFYDKENEEKIVITDSKGSVITLEDGKVSVVSSGDIELESKDGASIKLSDKVTIISPADIQLQCAGKVDVT
jgi:uncharacterized protein involved in type VI secretion and phage assembly